MKMSLSKNEIDKEIAAVELSDIERSEIEYRINNIATLEDLKSQEINLKTRINDQLNNIRLRREMKSGRSKDDVSTSNRDDEAIKEFQHSLAKLNKELALCEERIKIEKVVKQIMSYEKSIFSAKHELSKPDIGIPEKVRQESYEEAAQRGLDDVVDAFQTAPEMIQKLFDSKLFDSCKKALEVLLRQYEKEHPISGKPRFWIELANAEIEALGLRIGKDYVHEYQTESAPLTFMQEATPTPDPSDSIGAVSDAMGAVIDGVTALTSTPGDKSKAEAFGRQVSALEQALRKTSGTTPRTSMEAHTSPVAKAAAQDQSDISTAARDIAAKVSSILPKTKDGMDKEMYVFLSANTTIMSMLMEYQRNTSKMWIAHSNRKYQQELLKDLFAYEQQILSSPEDAALCRLGTYKALMKQIEKEKYWFKHGPKAYEKTNLWKLLNKDYETLKKEYKKQYGIEPTSNNMEDKFQDFIAYEQNLLPKLFQGARFAESKRNKRSAYLVSLQPADARPSVEKKKTKQ